MKKDIWRLWAITFLGFLTWVLPVLGFPRGFKSVLSSLFGFIMATLSFFVAKSLTHHYSHYDDAEDSKI